MYDEWCLDQQLNVLSCKSATKYYQYELCQTCTPREMTQQREMTQSREMTQPREMAIARADSQREMNEQREMTPPRTTLVLQSVQFSASTSTGCSACYSCPRLSPGSSHLPAPQTLRVLQLYYTVASSQLLAAQIAPRTKVVRQCRQFSASSSTDCSAY